MIHHKRVESQPTTRHPDTPIDIRLFRSCKNELLEFAVYIGRVGTETRLDRLMLLDLDQCFGQLLPEHSCSADFNHHHVFDHGGSSSWSHLSTFTLCSIISQTTQVNAHLPDPVKQPCTPRAQSPASAHDLISRTMSQNPGQGARSEHHQTPTRPS